MAGVNPPFSVYVRKNRAAPGLEIRFLVNDGTAILRLRGGRTEESVVRFEVDGVPIDALRAGRFVHVLQSGARQTYSLARVPSDLEDHLDVGEWHPLLPQVDAGFRYLLPGDFGTSDRSGLSERKARTVSVTPLPPRNVTVDPALAQAAMERLDRREALRMLTAEMKKTAALHRRVTQLEAQLASSRARELDLLEVLGRWQERS